LKLRLTWFDIINSILMILFLFVMVYPLLHVLSISLSGVTKLGIGLIPEQFTLKNYQMVLENRSIWTGFANTFIRVTVGTTLTLVVTILMAFALSKRDLPMRVPIVLFVVFTMFFNGGMIPNYIVVRNLGLIDSHWSLILPRLVDTFALIVMRNYFMTLPDALEESAKIEGASYYTILYRIIVPISMPIVATVVLWTAVWHWNSWFDAMIYIQTQDKQVIQIILRHIVMDGTRASMNLVTDNSNTMSNPDMIKAATIMVSTIPILCVYPFLQKYFVKGITIGSVKG
jgi:putative aldouronate transport system permease protein